MLKLLMLISVIGLLIGCTVSTNKVDVKTDYTTINITIVSTYSSSIYRSVERSYRVNYIINNGIDVHKATELERCFVPDIYEVGKTYKVVTEQIDGKIIPIDNLCVLTAKIISTKENTYVKPIEPIK